MSLIKQSAIMEEQLVSLRISLGPDASVVRDFERQLVSLRKAEERASQQFEPDTTEFVMGARNVKPENDDPMQAAMDAGEAFLAGKSRASGKSKPTQ